MKMTVRRNKGKSKLPALVEKLKALNNQSVKIGYFKEQGLHPTADMPYASLAYIHANAHEFSLPFPTRDIFAHMKPIVGGYPAQSTFFKRLLKNYVQIRATYTLENLLDDIGKKYRQDGKNVFGNTALLASSDNNTNPLIEQGFLRDAFAYKTSFNYKVREN